MAIGTPADPKMATQLRENDMKKTAARSNGKLKLDTYFKLVHEFPLV